LHLNLKYGLLFIPVMEKIISRQFKPKREEMKEKQSDKIIENQLLCGLLIACGWLSITLGVIGAFLPVMPTVPFLLLAAACFSRSSVRFHNWLLEHKLLGPILEVHLNGAGMPKKAKFTAIAMVWVSILTSAFFFVHLVWVRFVMIAIALCITIYLFRIPTAEEDE
jgi:uncharacterized protein